MDFNLIFPIGDLCSLGKSIFGSTFSLLWTIITFVGFWYSVLLLLVIAIWVIFEVLNRNTHSYNSENGFTPLFNSFVGATVYFGLQALIYIILQKLLTEAVYCLKWPYALHFITFTLTGLILCWIGFWRYWRPLGVGYKIRIR